MLHARKKQSITRARSTLGHYRQYSTVINPVNMQKITSTRVKVRSVKYITFIPRTVQALLAGGLGEPYEVKMILFLILELFSLSFLMPFCV